MVRWDVADQKRPQLLCALAVRLSRSYFWDERELWSRSLMSRMTASSQWRIITLMNFSVQSCCRLLAANDWSAGGGSQIPTPTMGLSASFIRNENARPPTYPKHIQNQGCLSSKLHAMPLRKLQAQYAFQAVDSAGAAISLRATSSARCKYLLPETCISPTSQT